MSSSRTLRASAPVGVLFAISLSAPALAETVQVRMADHGADAFAQLGRALFGGLQVDGLGFRHQRTDPEGLGAGLDTPTFRFVAGASFSTSKVD